MDERPPQFGPGFFTTFLYYFASTALLTTILASQGLNLSIASGLPQQLGIVVGLFAGLLGGYINRTESFSVGFSSQKTFTQRLNSILSDMGYQETETPDAGEDQVRVYRRSASGRFLSGAVFVQMTPKEAVIASRSLQLKRIRKRIES